MSLFTNFPVSLVNPKQPSAGGVKAITEQVLASTRGTEHAQQFGLGARADNSLQAQIDAILAVLKKPVPLPASFGLKDPDGRVIATFGYTAVGNAQNYGLTTYDLMGNLAAWIGVQTELPLPIVSTTNAAPDVITVTAHGYISGDTVLIAGATGDTAINGVGIVRLPTANTFQLTDFLGNPINGNGAYAGGGTAQRYYGGVLAQAAGIGGDGTFAGAKIRAFEDGSVVITNASLTIVSGTTTINIDGTNDIKVSDSALFRFTQMTPNSFRLQKLGDTFSYSQLIGFGFRSATGAAAGAGNASEIDFISTAGTGALGSLYDFAGNLQITLDASVPQISVGPGLGTSSTVIGNASVVVSSAAATATVSTGTITITAIGANPGLSLAPLSVSIAGNQIIGIRQAAVADVTLVTTETAGAAYTATEQSMLNHLKTDTISLKTELNLLLNRVRAATGHGLIA